MSAKSPKAEPVARDTLPRTPSQMSESSSSTVTASKTTVNVTEKSVLSPSIQVNGNAALGLDLSWHDSLSLKQLNDLLCKYIEKVHDMEMERDQTAPASRNITVSIDRKEIKNLESTYSSQIDDWKKKLEDKDKLINELKKKISQLEAQIEELKMSLSNKDKIINEKEKTISDLNMELAKLNAEIASLKSQLASANTGFENAKKIWELNFKQLQDERQQLNNRITEITNNFTSEKNRTYDLQSRLEAVERDLWFKIDLLSKELEVEREKTLSKTQIDISAVDQKFKGEYANRLQDELQILRKVYEQHMRNSKNEMEMMYNKKVAQYEMNKDAAYRAELISKETQIAHLMKQNEEYKKMYEDIMNKYLYDEQEVRVYNRLITPEVDRISKSKIRLEANGTFKRSKSNSDGEADGTSSEEEGENLKKSMAESKANMKKVVQQQTVVTTQKAVKETVSKQAGATAVKKQLN